MANRYRTNPQNLLSIVLVDKAQIKIPQTVGDPFEMTNFYLFKRQNKEWLLGEVDKAVDRWHEEDVGTGRASIETKGTEGLVE